MRLQRQTVSSGRSKYREVSRLPRASAIRLDLAVGGNTWGTLGPPVVSANRPLQHARALFAHEIRINTGPDLYRCIVLPSCPRIRPRVNPERPVSRSVGHNPRFKTINSRSNQVHAGTRVFFAVRSYEDDLGTELVVALPKDSCADRECFTFGCFCGEGRIGNYRKDFDGRYTAEKARIIRFHTHSLPSVGQ